MHSEIKQLLLVFECLVFVLFFMAEKQVAIVCLLSDLLILDVVLKYLNVTHVVGHVRRQDHADYALAEHLLLLDRVVFSPVVVLLAHQSHRLSGVEILLNCLIVVPESTIRHEVDMVLIVKAIVVEVVTGCSDDGRDSVDVIQLGDLGEISLLNDEVHHLGDISTVEVIMVLHFLPVASSNCLQKVDQFGLVDNASDGLAWQHAQDVKDDEG